MSASRRLAFLAGLLCLPGCSGPDPVASPNDVPLEGDFPSWLEARARATDPAVVDLYYSFFQVREQRPLVLSLRVSAGVLRFYLAQGDLGRARAIGDALLRWQCCAAAAGDGGGAGGNGNGGNSGRRDELLAGAFPAELDRDDGRFLAGQCYDSSENLEIVEALLALHEATGDPRHLDAAARTGRWLLDVMAKGLQLGMWAESHGALMHSRCQQGDVDATIDVGLLFQLPTLRRLSADTGDPTFGAVADRAFAFLMAAQATSGGFSDHYEPGRPPRPFDPSHFRAYDSDRAVTAEGSLLAGLGALAGGDRDSAERVARWIAHPGGRIPAILDLPSGGARFRTGEEAFDDVMASAMFARLAGRLGLPGAEEAARFVASMRADDGGFTWGWQATRGAPVADWQSTRAGLWAQVDLSPGAP